MNVLNKTLVAAGMATAVLATGAAQAATIENFPSTAVAPAPYAETIINETTRTLVDVQPVENPVLATAATAGFELVLGAGEDLSVDDSITITLSSGATWAAITQQSLLASIAAAAPLPANVALVAGGVGQNFATFRVTAGGVPAASHLQLDDGSINAGARTQINMAGVAAGSNVTITAEMSGFVGGVATSLYGSPLIYNAYDMAPARTAAVTTVRTGVFNVATGFTTLLSNATNVAPSTTGNAQITITTDANAIQGSTSLGADNTLATADDVPAGAPTANNLFFVLTGPMNGVSAVGGTNIQPATSAGAAVAAGVPGAFAVDTANNAAYGVASAISANHFITLTFDGTVVYDASSYTVAVSTTTDAAGYAANPSIGGGVTHTFTRNGSAFTSNSLGPLNKMTITDRSGALGAGGADGAINLTVFDKDGNVVTCTGLTIPNLPNNGTVTVQGEDITEACPGAKRIEGIVNSTTILTSNVKNTAGGTTVQSGVNNTTAIAQ